MHIYEVRPRKDKGGVDLVSDALPFGRLCYGEPSAISNAIDYAKFYSRSHDQRAMVRTSDAGCRRLDLILDSGGLGAALATRFSDDFVSMEYGRPTRKGSPG